MIFSCSCGAKLKISDEKLTDAGVKVKCPKCGVVHRVEKPKTETSAQEKSSKEEKETVQKPPMPWFAQSLPSLQQPLVLIAHDSRAVADMIEGVLKQAGMAVEYAPNGLEALKKAADMKPKAMIVDVGLTGIYGFELCERLKRNPETQGIKIILLSSVYGLTAYKRSPVSLYGADDYIEKHHIPDSLIPKLQALISGRPQETPQPFEHFPEQEPETKSAAMPATPLISRKGLMQEARGRSEKDLSERPKAEPQSGKIVLPEIPSIIPKTPVTLNPGVKITKEDGREVAARLNAESEPAKSSSASAAVQAETVVPSAAGLQFAKDESVSLDASFFEHEEYDTPQKAPAEKNINSEEIEKARRFARIIVSDIALYNQEAVAEGIENGTIYDLLKEDIIEGRALYEKRVPQAIREIKDFFQEAFDNFIESKKKLR